MPPNSGKPSATTSNRLVSWACGTAKSMSLIIMLRVTRPPASRQTLAAALSTANRAVQTHRLSNTLHHGGQRNQGTATSAQTEGEREAETPEEENAKQSRINAGEETRGGQLRAPSLHRVHCATVPFRALPIWAPSSDPGNGAQLSRLLRVASWNPPGSRSSG